MMRVGVNMVVRQTPRASRREAEHPRPRKRAQLLLKVAARCAQLSVLGMCLLIHLNQATAESPEAQGFSLSWTRAAGAEGCVSSERLIELITQSMDAEQTERHARVDGRIQKLSGGSGFRAVVRARDEEQRLLGERVLESTERNCGELTTSLVLVITLMLEPVQDDWVGVELAQPSQESAQVTKVAPEGDGERAPGTSGPATPHWFHSMEGHAALSVSALALPGPTPGIDAGVSWHTASGVSLDGAVAVWLPRHPRGDQDDGSAGPRARAVHGVLSLCIPSWTLNRFEVRPCAGALVGRLRGRADIATDAPKAQHTYGGGALGTDFYYALSAHARLVLGMRVAVTMPPASTATLDESGRAQPPLHASPIWLWSSLGAAMRF